MRALIIAAALWPSVAFAEEPRWYGTRDIALGLSHDENDFPVLEAFTRGLRTRGFNVSYYEEWKPGGTRPGAGMNPLAGPNNFPRQFYHVVRHAMPPDGRIHFQLHRLRINELNKPLQVTGRVTAWELEQILHDKDLHARTDFYLGNRMIDRSELPGRGLGVRPPLALRQFWQMGVRTPLPMAPPPPPPPPALRPMIPMVGGVLALAALNASMNAHAQADLANRVGFGRTGIDQVVEMMLPDLAKRLSAAGWIGRSPGRDEIINSFLPIGGIGDFAMEQQLRERRILFRVIQEAARHARATLPDDDSRRAYLDAIEADAAGNAFANFQAWRQWKRELYIRLIRADGGYVGPDFPIDVGRYGD